MFISHPYVTQKEWNEFLISQGKTPHKPDTSLPVVDISAYKADSYCAWAGGRLPTDEELGEQFCPLWEWTSTTDGISRLVRGGSWNLNTRSVRASNRSGYEPAFRNLNIGFRCIKERELAEEIRHVESVLSDCATWPIGADKQEFLMDLSARLRDVLQQIFDTVIKFDTFLRSNNENK